MKIHFNKFLVVLLLIAGVSATSVAQLTVPNYTACPNQVITVTSTWNNASSISYSLYAPPVGGSPVQNPTTNTFNISNPTAGTVVYTLVASGVFGGNQQTSTAVFNLNILVPPAMVISHASGNNNYCNGSIVTLNAPVGGNTYSYSGSYPSGTSAGNIINFGPVNSSNTGAITVVSVINGCTLTGVTNINVAPLKVVSISAITTTCQGSCVTLTANLPGGTGYQWFDNNNIPTTTAPSYVACGANLTNSLTINDAGIYRVNVTDPFAFGVDCPYTATTQINVVQTSPLTVAASPSNIVCQGTNLAFNAAAVNNVTVSAWSWSGPGFSSAIANPVISPALPANTGCYTVTATFQGAFLACYTKATICATVTAVSAPVINAPSSVCEGSSLSIVGSAASNPSSFTWSGPLFPTPTSSASVNFSTVPTSASGTQFLTAYFNNQQCSATSSIQLNVVPVNSVSVIPPGAVCTPANAFLQALATGASQYSWAGPNGYVNSGPNVWVTAPTPAYSGNYTVTAYFGSGTSLVCTNTNVINLVVNPTLPFTLEPRQQVCYNTPVTITGPSGATSYTWTSSTGYTSHTKDVTFASAQPPNAGNYTLVAALGSCTTSAESEIAVLTPVVFTLTPFDRTICRGDTVFLECGASGGSENYAYVWNPSLYLESSTSPKQTVIPLGTIGYNVTVYDIACPNFLRGHSFNVNVNQPPVPKLELPTTYGCSPLKLNYNSKVKNESFVTTYDFNDGLKRVQGDSIDITLTEGTYNLKIFTVSKGNGCSGYYNYPYPIVVNPKPGTDIYWNPETPTTNDVITFYPTYKSEPIVYQAWNFLGGITPGDTSMHSAPGKTDTSFVKNPTRLYEQFGSYPIVLISQNEQGCSDTVYKVVKVIDELQLYIPNSFTPNDDGINDEFMAKGTGVKAENFSMDIFNRAGVNVFSTKDINQGWNGKVGGQYTKDATYIYKIRAVGMNGEGRREITGYVTIIK